MIRSFLTFIAICVLYANAVAQDDRVLMTIEDDKITVDEFLAIYNKNNATNVVDKKSMVEYVDLFVNFKLKVKAAEALGLDTAQKFINELSGYRQQLAQPYLVDREMNQALLDEAYERMQFDVAAYHILVKVPENAPSADTIAAIKRLKEFAKGIKAEDDMQATIERIKRMGDENVIAEDLGYFTAFSMVYPFETAAYETMPGTLSKPVRTRFGYHIIFVKDKRPARGEIRTSHIMVRSGAEMTPEEQSMAEARINEIYARLESGEDFSNLAKEYSDDKGSARNGGKLPWFGTGRMVAEFEDAAFALEENGQYSKPVKTRYGWHIIKRDEYKGIPPYDEVKGSLKKRIERDARSEKGRSSLLAKLKAEYALSYNYKNRDAVNKLVNSEYLKNEWKLEIGAKMKEAVVLTITDNKFSNSAKSFTQADYLGYLLKNQKKSSAQLKDVLAEHWEGFVNDALIEFESEILDQKYPEFKALMQEYHDGILLFDLMDKKVWSKAVSDTSGLEAHYENNKTEFMWEERVDASVYICANEEVAKKTMKMAKKRLKKGYADNDILQSINKDNALDLAIRSGIYAKGDDEYVDLASWTPGFSELDGNGGKKVIVQIYNQIEPQPKTLDECRGLVTSSYQNYLEREWINELRNKYSFEVNREVLNSIKE